MDFSLLFQKQTELDKHIETKHGLEKESLLDRKLMAFYVELAELANETRSFKFWSEKGPSEYEVILEEYVDGIHFILSVGLEQGFQDEPAFKYPDISVKSGEELVPYFYNVIEAVSSHRKAGKRSSYRGLFESYLELGAVLGFPEHEIIDAYEKKNEVNYERQKEGY